MSVLGAMADVYLIEPVTLRHVQNLHIEKTKGRHVPFKLWIWLKVRMAARILAMQDLDPLDVSFASRSDFLAPIHQNVSSCQVLGVFTAPDPSC